MLMKKSEERAPKNEETEPKWKQGPAVDVSAGVKVKSDARKSNIA